MNKDKFLNNKYFFWYFSLIEKVRTRILPEGIYIEKHHILPKSMGGLNDSVNLVVLTAREHFIAHRLLVKCTEGADKAKMIHALWKMACMSSYRNHYIEINSVVYERLRKNYSIFCSIYYKKHPTKGCFKKGHCISKKLSKKISERMLGNTYKKGKKLSKESCEKISKSKLGTRNIHLLGTKASPEKIEKMRLGRSTHSYLIEDITGKLHYTISPRFFAKENNCEPYWKLNRTLFNHKFYNNFRIIEKRKNG